MATGITPPYSDLPLPVALPSGVRSLGNLRSEFLKAGWPWGDLAVSTAASYSSGLTTLVRRIGPEVLVQTLTGEAVNAAFASQCVLTPVRVSQIRGGWRRFRDWAGLKYRIFLPDVPSRQASARTGGGIPPEVSKAVYRLFHSFGRYRPTQSYFVTIQWGDVRKEGDEYLLPRGKKGHFLPCAPEPLLVLRAFAQGDNNEPPTGPLLPNRRGGSDPIPLSSFRRLLTAAREAQEPQVEVRTS